MKLLFDTGSDSSLLASNKRYTEAAGEVYLEIHEGDTDAGAVLSLDEVTKLRNFLDKVLRKV